MPANATPCAPLLDVSGATVRFGGIHARLLDALHHHYHEDVVLTPMHRYGGYA